MNKKSSTWLALAALLMFVAATFQIAGDRFILGVVFFGSAICFTAAANKYREKEGRDKKEEAEKQ